MSGLAPSLAELDVELAIASTRRSLTSRYLDRGPHGELATKLEENHEFWGRQMCRIRTVTLKHYPEVAIAREYAEAGR